MLTLQEVRQVEALLAAGVSSRKVARRMRVSCFSVQRIRSGRHPQQLRPREPDKVTPIVAKPKPEVAKVPPPKLKVTPAKRPPIKPPHSRSDHGAYLPSPEEIVAKCEEFRRRNPRRAVPRYRFPVLSQL
ncbi:helix-turn-helix domain-containing protein [Aeoliella sp.]|uniref:helix-turn-helix domain-containing protein n=1 Tax=Aeoliella sp. TaxID=2795800 RepID=UPI003CCBE6C0